MSEAREANLSTGRFETRPELTCHIWSMHRQQLFPNYKSIAQECSTTAEVVKDVIASCEGLDEYMVAGCLIGG